jgi:hypothetical protein
VLQIVTLTLTMRHGRPEHGHVPAPRGRGSGGAQRGQATAAMKLASQGPRPPVGPGIGPEMGPGPYMPGRGPMGMPPGLMSGDPRRTSLAPGYMGQVCRQRVSVEWHWRVADAWPGIRACARIHVGLAFNGVAGSALRGCVGRFYRHFYVEFSCC